MKKRMISIALCLAIALALLPASPLAAAAPKISSQSRSVTVQEGWPHRIG